MSQRHQEGLAHLLYGIDSGGFVVLTGEVGTGKTTLCHCLLQQLPDDVDLALILNPKLNSLELLANICDELGIGSYAKKSGLKDFNDLLNKYLLDAHASGRRTVLMIDEAQNLNLDVLEQIRLLTNLETAKTKLLQIVLVGQPELKKLLAREELRQLNQRITARYHLEPLTLEETKHYIHHRLTVSGGDSGIFKKSAIRRVHKWSAGIPRLINILCDRALLGAYANGVKQVTPAIVDQAAKEVLDLQAKPRYRVRLFFFVIVLVAVGLLLVNLFASFHDRETLQVTPPVHAEKSKEIQQFEKPLSLETSVIQPQLEVAGTSDRISSIPLSSVKGDQIESESEKFVDFIANPDYSLSRALAEAMRLWGETVSQGMEVHCDDAEKRDLLCLAEHGSLKELLGFDRPAILEFTLADGQRRHVLLVGMDRGYPIFRSIEGQDIVFPLEEVLGHWQGLFLIVWRTPLDHGMTGIYPYNESTNVLWLRDKLDRIEGHGSLDTDQPQYFDDQLVSRVKRFQKRHGLKADGIVGPKTIIYLQNRAENEDVPKLKHID